MTKLRSTDGRRWAVMARYDIPDAADPNATYLTRWRIVQTPWAALYLHKIVLDDGARPLHDHPWAFASLVLWGGYDERRARDVASWRAGTVHRMAATDRHSIRRLHRSPTWTLLLVGRRTREWGYHTPAGWVRHDLLDRSDALGGSDER